jgi:hypothetical protein
VSSTTQREKQPMSQTTAPSATTVPTDPELHDLLQSLARQRHFLRFTVRNLTDDQARSHPIPSSELTLGGLIKHVTAGEDQWMDFAVHGASAMGSESLDFDEEDFDWNSPYLLEWSDGFRMLENETLDGLLAAYQARAIQTEAVLKSLELNTAHELPQAPWFEAGASWTVRRVVLHLIGETSQHAGHADILREALDGQKTMG